MMHFNSQILALHRPNRNHGKLLQIKNKEIYTTTTWSEKSIISVLLLREWVGSVALVFRIPDFADMM